ncbi:MAG TPA: TonB C-terminal domain-containing protein [Verrucomicrobiae bacterium]|nr:TonB C-terminal domain-containing protein [Verrucomicrobiae bacterium]
MREPRRKRNSPKTNFTISFIVHGVLILVAFVFAAREGILGKKLRELTVLIAPEPKKPEPPKEKPPEPKPEPAKVAETPKAAPVARVAMPATVASAPPPAAGPAMAAPPAANLPSFDFSDGAKAVGTGSGQDGIGIYRAQVEYSLRSRWNRPDSAEDDKFVAEVQLDVDPAGNIIDWRLVKGSGDSRWDDSVKAAMKDTPNVGRPRPKSFPEQFLVRFDVQTSDPANAIQLDIK